MTAIRVDNVHKTFSRGRTAVHALADVSLSVEPGEIFGLLGANGAGKTTLVKILLDIVRPTRGETLLHGVSSRRTEARRGVGYLPEDHRFPEYQTAASALAFYGALSGVSGGTLRSRTVDLLQRVNLADATAKKVRTFSKGMKQRLGLAQALVHDPQILFLDEPTDGVDPVGRAEIRDLLAQLKGEGRTIFLNSHLLSEVETLCDRVAILDRGKVVRTGTIDELTHTGHTWELRTAAPLSTDARAAIDALCRELRATADGSLELTLADADAIDAVIDALRQRGVGVRHLVAKRMTLEQVFLATLGDAAEAKR